MPGVTEWMWVAFIVCVLGPISLAISVIFGLWAFIKLGKAAREYNEKNKKDTGEKFRFRSSRWVSKGE